MLYVNDLDLLKNPPYISIHFTLILFREKVSFTKLGYLMSLSLKVKVHGPFTEQSLDHHVDVTWYFE